MAVSNEKKNFVQLHYSVLESILEQEKQFSKENVDKALCATGHKDKGTTIKWLHAHNNDPTLNHHFQREYIIFLCPTGPLLTEISKFYEASFNKCGGNSAHNLFPHVTLSSFFKVSDSMLPYLLDILKNTLQTANHNQPTKFKLTLECSPGYIGVFLTEQTQAWLSEALSGFIRRIDAELGVHIKPQDRQFHLTLAYNFDQSKTEELEHLAKKVNIDSPARWELNIYSRDPRFNGKQFLLAVYDFKASEPDELDLRLNNHVIMETETSQLKGWKKGIDFNTGKIGFFPENFTKKTAEWRIWTKNISLPLTHVNEKHSHHPLDERTNHKPPRRSQSVNYKRDKKEHLRHSLRSASRTHYNKEKSKKERPVDASTWEPVVRTSTAINPKVANHVRRSSLDAPKCKPLEGDGVEKKIGSDSNRTSRRVDRDSKVSINDGGFNEIRRVFIMRHAERVDLTFGHDWFNIYIDDRGYHRRNLNLPRRIPTRRAGPKDFFMDGPITEIGTFQAQLIGEALKAKGVSFTAIYCSPSLRCVQTATSVLLGLMDSHTKIKIEPALFEWMAWCRNTLPKFMSPDELVEYGVNIDRSYVAYFPCSQFNLHEKTDDYYHRSQRFVDTVTRISTGNVLMVGHSATLDVCSRQLVGHAIRKTDDLIRVVQKVPFCGMCTVEERSHKLWQLVQTPIPSLAHGQNQTFDWRVLESTPSSVPYKR